MSVPKGKRGLSEMEFYATAVRLRTEITSWLMRDFGIKTSVRNVDFVSKKHKMSEEDNQLLKGILEKYSLGDSICLTYPDWWIAQRRSAIDKILSDLAIHITTANSIYPIDLEEFWERRLHQDRAIACVYCLLEELQFVISVLWRTTGVDVETYMPYVDLCNTEIALLKGWRKADNKILQRLKKVAIC